MCLGATRVLNKEEVKVMRFFKQLGVKALFLIFVPFSFAYAQDEETYISEIYPSDDQGNCEWNARPTDGSLVTIRQNNALFALAGTQFGGDGRTTLLFQSWPTIAFRSTGFSPSYPKDQQYARNRAIGSIFMMAATFCPDGSLETKGQVLDINRFSAALRHFGDSIRREWANNVRFAK